MITFFTGFEWRQAAINTLIGTALALSVVVITGYVGQISLAQAALGGIAGFALAKLFQRGTTVFGVEIPRISFPWGPILAAIIASGFGLLVAIPALRVRGVNLAIVTMAAALAIEELVFRNRKLAGASGTLGVDPPSIFGKDLGPNNTELTLFGVKARVDGGVSPQAWWLVLCLVVVTLLALMVANVRRSATGRQFLAVRSNERAAAAAGINVSATKLLAFGLSAFIAGIGGVLSGYRFQGVTPSNFGVLASITLLAFAYLGGVGTISGAVAAGMIGTNALVFTFLDRFSGVDTSFTLYLAALGLIVTAVLNPEGIAGGIRLGILDATRKRILRQPHDGGR